MFEQSNAKVRQAFLDMLNAWNAVVSANRRLLFVIMLLMTIIVLLSSVPAVSASDLPSYRIKDLGTLGGTESAANAINASSQIVGWSNVKAGSDIRHAFLWKNGKMKDLGTLGGDNSEARGINDNGWVVGVSQVTPGSDAVHAFLWKNGRMIDLGTLGGINSEANAINNRNEIVGWSETEVNPGYYVYGHAFRWVAGVMKTLAVPPCPFGDDHGSEANTINRDDQIVGARSCYRGGNTSRFLLLWDYDDSVTDLCSAYDAACGTPQGINHKEQITFIIPGSHGFQSAYLWDNGDHAVIDLGTETAHAINDSGMLVGKKTKNGTAYVWRKGKLQDLPSLPGIRSEAIGINNDDVIVGWSWTADSNSHAVVWRP